MHLKTSLGSAYIHNLDLVDKSKEVILLVTGAGMDHRVADLFHPNPEIYNKVIYSNIILIFSYYVLFFFYSLFN